MLFSNNKIFLLLVTFSIIGYVQSRCGLNQNLQECPETEKNCTRTCRCNHGFVGVQGKDYCEPKSVRCAFRLLLDLVFVIDGSKHINENMFNDAKSFLVEILKNVYSSGNDVRVGIVIYGPKNPTVIFLDKTESLCEVLKIITDIRYVPNGKDSTLLDGAAIAGHLVLSQCYGARIGSIKHIFVIGQFSELQSKEKDRLFKAIEFGRKQGYRTTLLSIGDFSVPQHINLLTAKTTKGLSQHLAQIFEITCRADMCSKGYQKVGYHCIDINECDSSACHDNSKCINTPGSFICYCSGGLEYISRDKGCGPKPEQCPAITKVITVCDAVTCKAPGTCTNSNGMNFCICPRGFEYDVKNGCLDVDECRANPCLRNGNCKNSNGSFECSCGAGFEYNINFGCIDVDECLNTESCSGNGICVNTVGSYNCTCNRGYDYIANKGCVDIDECTAFNNTCEGENVTCVNTPGSYQCVCPTGFEHKEKKCVDINECLNATSCPRSSTCRNEIGSYSCDCNKGFIFVEINKTCELDKSMDVVQARADLLFVVDASENMKGHMDIVKDMLVNIITDYIVKSSALIKRYFAITTGGNSEVKIIYTKETDRFVLNRTDSIVYMGGKSVFSDGLRTSKELYVKDGQINSSKVVISITATKPSTYSSEEITAIKKQVKEIKRDGKLLIIYIGNDVKSSDWSVVFTDSERDEYVIAATQDFIATIHKVVYEKTDRLIKCPDGFIFLDKVCQYKTASAIFCKWDNKLYALNSTWTSACAIYNCTEKGVVLYQRKCMGFDGDCYNDDEFFPCTLEGKLNWRCKCKISTTVDKDTNKVTQTMDYIIVDFDKNASINAVKLLDATGKCELPFKYENQWYYACTDAKSIKRWCSHTTFYKKIYSYCAPQVISQCIFENKTYNEGEQWKVGCNDVQCSSGQPRITARCLALNGTCVSINTDSYPCMDGNSKFESCICVQDNYGYGKNSGIKGKVTEEGSKINGSLVEFCLDTTTGTKYELGSTWIKNCFTLRCSSGGLTKIESRKCEAINKNCIEPGSDKFFACDMNGVTKDNCKCTLENNEVVLVTYEGAKKVTKTVETQKVLDIFKSQS